MDIEEMTSLHDAEFDRVDLVGKAANGSSRFLIAKSATHSLLSPTFVNELITGQEANMTAPSTPVVKAIDDMDPLTVLAAPLIDVIGDPDVPGSPAWEAIDSATAMKWSAILTRAKNALEVMGDREMQEAVTCDESDADNAWNLDDACCAIDYAISILAPYAINENAEAHLGSEELEGIAKAMRTFDAVSLEAVEGFTSVAKAGRTLSTGNEAALRAAVESIQKVLASLPVAVEPVTKEIAVSDIIVEPVEKAAGDPMQIVYNSAGKVIGIVDPSKVIAITSDEAVADAGEDSTVETADDIEPAAADDVDDAPVVESPDAADPADAADPDDLTPAPSADAGITSEDVTKAQTEIVKAAITAGIKEALTAQEATTASVVKSLEDRIAALEGPAPSRVLSSGAMPPAHLMRGQDADATSIDIAKAQALRAQLYGSDTVGAREDVMKTMNESAIAALTALRGQH